MRTTFLLLIMLCIATAVSAFANGKGWLGWLAILIGLLMLFGYGATRIERG